MPPGEPLRGPQGARGPRLRNPALACGNFFSKNTLYCQDYKFFSQLTVCAVEHRIYSILCRGLWSFFHHFLRLIINGGLHFHFFTFLKGTGDAQSFLATFCRAVLPQASRQKVTRSEKKSLDLEFLRWNSQFCLKWWVYLLYCPKAFTSFASLPKYIMLKPGTSHSNNKIFKLFSRAENDTTREYNRGMWVLWPGWAQWP